MTTENDITEIKTTMAVQAEQIGAIRASLVRLEPMIIKIMESQARIEGRIEGMPSATEFGELRGRVEEISRGQGVTLAYTPPESRRAGGT
ncbi:hypothetical protein WCLP8_4660015 [uncultured Gammaproteobacteria bacterium]